MINILTDSCVDLPPEILQRYKLDLVRLPVTVAGKSYFDGLDIQTSELFELVAENNTLPKTAAPSVGAFLRFFDREGTNIYCGIGGKLSAALQNATAAKNELPHRDIRLIDSFTLSAAIGLLVLKAADMRDQGCSADEIVNWITDNRHKARISFVIDTLDYLYKGGRCTAIEHIFGSVLKIHPVIEVKKDGTLGIREKTRGARTKGIDAIISGFQKNLKDINLRRVIITHTCQQSDVDYVTQKVKSMADIEELLTTTAGATIASHCGPNTLGIGYMLK
jgi:DegV family protein with EDD domain